MLQLEPCRQFAKDSARLVKRCTKPDRKVSELSLYDWMAGLEIPHSCFVVVGVVDSKLPLEEFFPIKLIKIDFCYS